MVRRVGFAALAVLSFAVSGCGPSAGSVLQDLFKAAPPANVQVVHYQADTMGMDPSFAWELAPIDQTYLKRLIAGGGLKAAAAGNRPSSGTYHWPKWWDTKHIDALPECYFDESSGLRRVWVDRKNNRMFVEFLGT